MQVRRSKRRSLRRALALECGVQSDLWDGTLAMPTSDISNEGMWIPTAFPLDPGEEVVLCLKAPGTREGEEIWAMAEVARVGMWRRRIDPWPVGMGLTLTYCSKLDRERLTRSLQDHPPRLPLRHRPPPLPPRSQAFRGLDRRCQVLTLDDVEFAD